jgi:hypothetical protein
VSAQITGFRGRFPGERAALEYEEPAFWAGVAQLVEHLICNQRVGGSNPFASSIKGERPGRNGSKFLDWRWILGAGPVLCGDPTEVHARMGRMSSGWGGMLGISVFEWIGECLGRVGWTE